MKSTFIVCSGMTLNTSLMSSLIACVSMLVSSSLRRRRCGVPVGALAFKDYASAYVSARNDENMPIVWREAVRMVSLPRET
jgi:hypothetical protein